MDFVRLVVRGRVAVLAVRGRVVRLVVRGRVAVLVVRGRVAVLVVVRLLVAVLQVVRLQVAVLQVVRLQVAVLIPELVLASYLIHRLFAEHNPQPVYFPLHLIVYYNNKIHTHQFSIHKHPMSWILTDSLCVSSEIFSRFCQYI
jgi:hypothetical protein